MLSGTRYHRNTSIVDSVALDRNIHATLEADQCSEDRGDAAQSLTTFTKRCVDHAASVAATALCLSHRQDRCGQAKSVAQQRAMPFC